MSEVLAMKGLLAETKRKINELSLDMVADMREVRSVYNPYEDDLTIIDAEMARVKADKIKQTQSELIRLITKKKQLEREING
jgi:hypothetical protein